MVWMSAKVFDITVEATIVNVNEMRKSLILQIETERHAY